MNGQVGEWTGGSSGPSLCPSPPGPGGPVPAGGGTGCFGWMWSSCRVPSARLLRLSCPGWPLWAEGPERVRSLRAAWLAGQVGAPPRTGLMAHPGSPPHPHPRLRPGPYFSEQQKAGKTAELNSEEHALLLSTLSCLRACIHCAGFCPFRACMSHAQTHQMSSINVVQTQHT